MQFPSGADAEFIRKHIGLLVNTYSGVVGRPLPVSPVSEETDALAEALFFAPFALVSHTAAADPVFNFANQTALNLFEMTWPEFTQLPSRFSAEPGNRETRAALLRQVTEHGFIDNYSGIRISSSGKRFRIHEAVVWNVIDTDGIFHGQAALFQNWTYL